MRQAEDFRTETQVLAEVLEPLKDADFGIRTQFKGWSIDDVLGHLHMFNVAAQKALDSRDAFDDFLAPITRRLQQGQSLVQAQYPWLDGLRGRSLFSAWRDTANALADAFAHTDPKTRLAWVGPDMSALSSLTARQMETWAHGQEVFDALGQGRPENDRIRNICVLGVNTHGWTFQNRGLPIPTPAPHVRLIAPSGAVWTWHPDQPENRVQGTAVDFARVVTQVRNIADTDLLPTGPAARDWMAMAQCFAGAPEDPPAPGTRYRVDPD